MPYFIKAKENTITIKVIWAIGKKLKRENVFDFSVMTNENIYVIEYNSTRINTIVNIIGPFLLLNICLISSLKEFRSANNENGIGIARRVNSGIIIKKLLFNFKKIYDTIVKGATRAIGIIIQLPINIRDKITESINRDKDKIINRPILISNITLRRYIILYFRNRVKNQNK